MCGGGVGRGVLVLGAWASMFDAMMALATSAASAASATAAAMATLFEVSTAMRTAASSASGAWRSRGAEGLAGATTRDWASLRATVGWGGPSRGDNLRHSETIGVTPKP